MEKDETNLYRREQVPWVHVGVRAGGAGVREITFVGICKHLHKCKAHSRPGEVIHQDVPGSGKGQPGRCSRRQNPVCQMLNAIPAMDNLARGSSCLCVGV
ncbi:unnamed protein product [Pleuronectes platessa]|uniref:Uncharacterized protein n=1 Tax=Pleuronectes platessa TaxID=8262 RepID=A0A9N7Y9H6_PLEPL|nr:unnamed protein product [Pleuronectes platessa]